MVMVMSQGYIRYSNCLCTKCLKISYMVMVMSKEMCS